MRSKDSAPIQHTGTSPQRGTTAALSEERGGLSPLAQGLPTGVSRESLRTEAYLTFIKAMGKVHDKLLVSPECSQGADPFVTKKNLQRHFEVVSSALGMAVEELRIQAGITSDVLELISSARERVFNEFHAALDQTYDTKAMSVRSEFALKGLSENVVDSVRKGFAGWIKSDERMGQLKECLQECHSLNEITHVVHTFAMQNEEILNGLARWGTSKNAEGECVGVGAETPFAREVFSIASSLFTTLESPRLFVFGYDGGSHLMLRDYGHATTIALTPDGKGDVILHFFIPKVVDERCLQALPGEVVSYKGEYTARVAKGVFKVAQEELAPALTQFIKLLPTDAQHRPAGAFTVPWKY